MSELIDNTVPRELFTQRYHNKPYPFISPTRPELSAAGKNVIVTGGGTGIGKAIAKAFVQAGAKSVAILGRRKNVLEAALEEISASAQSPTDLLYRVADLTVEDQTSTAVASISSQVGPIDIFVSNAGSVPTLAPVAEYDSRDLLRAFELNVISCLHAVRAFVPVATSSPTFINISSSMAHAPPLPALGMSAYSASKAANLKMMDYFAAENPHYHIVNVQPGIVATDMADNNGMDSDIGQDEPDLAGHFCVWLTSPEATFLKSKFVWANWDAAEMVSRAAEIENSDQLRCILNTGAK